MLPRAALEFVLKYLPETKGKERDAAIRNFIFSHPVASDETVASLIQQDEELNSNLFPPNFPLWILEAKSDTTTSESQEDVSGDLDLEGIPWKVLQKAGDPEFQQKKVWAKPQIPAHMTQLRELLMMKLM